jgi:2-polyprenyl-3-methyl-5-hydroxy-6-metoxy-1,4-benzoquinol methylase
MMYSCEHYDKFWEGIIKKLPVGGSYRFDMRKEGYGVICDAIPENSKTFDYACGLGMVSISLSKEKYCSVFGCDWSGVAIDYVNAETGTKNFKKTDEIFGDSYDCAIVSHFLEHIENPVEFLDNIFKKTKKIIVSLPNNFRHIGEHIHMQWSNWDEFYKLFDKYDIERIDEGKYTNKTLNAWQHPIFIFKEKDMHQFYREEDKKEVIKPKKKVKKKKKVVKKDEVIEVKADEKSLDSSN